MSIVMITVLLAAVGPAPVGAAVDPAARCAAMKVKAAGKKYNSKAKCHAKAILRGVSVSAACLQQAEDKYLAAFAKADAIGSCAGDAAAIEADIDVCLAGLLNHVTPPPTTTTTTTTTLPVDLDPPGISSAQATGATQVEIVFDEPILASSVLPNGSNFVLTNGAVVFAATLQPDNVTVVLVTSVLIPFTTYTVTVGGITDVAGNAIMAPDNTATF